MADIRNDLVIEIFCNQTDCKWNITDSLEFPEIRICSHLHPNIQRYKTLANIICNSKERDMTDPNTKTI
jgi:hypothetical protein